MVQVKNSDKVKAGNMKVALIIHLTLPDFQSPNECKAAALQLYLVCFGSRKAVAAVHNYISMLIERDIMLEIKGKFSAP